MITKINQFKRINERFIPEEELIIFEYNGVEIGVTEIEELVVNKIPVLVDDEYGNIAYKTKIPTPSSHYGNTPLYKTNDGKRVLSGQSYINIFYMFTSTLLDTNSVEDAINVITDMSELKSIKLLKYLEIIK